MLVAVTDGQPKIMTIANAGALPSGPFEFAHRSLQSGLRAWVETQTGHPLGYVEQLYTFADRGRTGDAKRRIDLHQLSRPHAGGSGRSGLRGPLVRLVRLFPVGRSPRRCARDARENAGAAAARWAKSAAFRRLQRERWQRAAITFGLDGRDWNEELVLQRYELLYEAG